MRRRYMTAWIRLLVGGGLLFNTAVASCLASQLRAAGDELNRLADDVHDDRSDLQKLVDDIKDSF